MARNYWLVSWFGAPPAPALGSQHSEKEGWGTVAERVPSGGGTELQISNSDGKQIMLFVSISTKYKLL